MSRNITQPFPATSPSRLSENFAGCGVIRSRNSDPSSSRSSLRITWTPEQERLGLKTACVIAPGLLPIDFGYERQRIRSLSRSWAVAVTVWAIGLGLSMLSAMLNPSFVS